MSWNELMRRMAELRGTGESAALSDAIRAAEQKQRSRDTEMAAMTEAWAKRILEKMFLNLVVQKLKKYMTKLHPSPLPLQLIVRISLFVDIAARVVRRS